MNGNAVMYDVGKILTVGGATAYQDSHATERAYPIDITGGPGTVDGPHASATWPTPAPSQQRGPARRQVLVVGGQQHPQSLHRHRVGLSPELWNPATGDFTVMAPEAVPAHLPQRALLLPDGRVFSGGGGLCGNCATNHADGQIFTPPYLLNADGTAAAAARDHRAPATRAAGRDDHGDHGRAVTRFALVRTSARHPHRQHRPAADPADADQRQRHQHTCGSRPTGVALPGPYLLFALDASGVPSVATTIFVQ